MDVARPIVDSCRSCLLAVRRHLRSRARSFFLLIRAATSAIALLMSGVSSALLLANPPTCSISGRSRTVNVSGSDTSRLSRVDSSPDTNDRNRGGAFSPAFPFGIFSALIVLCALPASTSATLTSTIARCSAKVGSLVISSCFLLHAVATLLWKSAPNLVFSASVHLKSRALGAGEPVRAERLLAHVGAGEVLEVDVHPQLDRRVTLDRHRPVRLVGQLELGVVRAERRLVELRVGRRCRRLHVHAAPAAGSPSASPPRSCCRPTSGGRVRRSRRPWSPPGRGCARRSWQRPWAPSREQQHTSVLFPVPALVEVLSQTRCSRRREPGGTGDDELDVGEPIAEATGFVRPDGQMTKSLSTQTFPVTSGETTADGAKSSLGRSKWGLRR